MVTKNTPQATPIEMPKYTPFLIAKEKIASANAPFFFLFFFLQIRNKLWLGGKRVGVQDDTGSDKHISEQRRVGCSREGAGELRGVQGERTRDKLDVERIGKDGTGAGARDSRDEIIHVARAHNNLIANHAGRQALCVLKASTNIGLRRRIVESENIDDSVRNLNRIIVVVARINRVRRSKQLHKSGRIRTTNTNPVPVSNQYHQTKQTNK
jgi:hypothetical protein